MSNESFTNLHSAQRVLAGSSTHVRLERDCHNAGCRGIERYAAVPSLADPRALPAWRAISRPGHDTGRLQECSAQQPFQESFNA